MSLEKAVSLLRLAELAASRHGGVSLQQIAEEFEVNHRTAQRMTKALEETFDHVEVLVGEDRRRYWRLRESRFLRLQGLRDSELVALDMGIRRAEREGATHEVKALISLRDRLLATMPRTHARRAEVDAEAILEAHGFASRPGPRIRVAPLVLETIVEALKGPFRLPAFGHAALSCGARVGGRDAAPFPTGPHDASTARTRGFPARSRF